jgi:hypothetical protein
MMDSLSLTRRDDDDDSSSIDPCVVVTKEVDGMITPQRQA